MMSQYLRAASACAIAFAVSSSLAQQAVAQAVAHRNTSSPNEAGRWTPERMRAATALPLPRSNQVVDRSVPPSPAEILEKSESAEGYMPPVLPTPARSQRLQSPMFESRPESKGRSSLPYTTSLVFPDSQVNQLPYILTGILVFTDGGDNLAHFCTASIIRRRIVVTAAHCLYNTKVNKWNSNFLFAPSFNGTLSTPAPFGVWDWQKMWVMNGWINGTGTVPNAFDYGLIEMRDNGTTVIGDYLGYFGYITNKLIGNSVTQLGYSENLDGGNRMLQNAAEARAAAKKFAGEIGSALAGGSSGGPWVQNFGVGASGQAYSGGGGANQIVAVTSYGPTNRSFEYAGATIFNASFVKLLNGTVCKNRDGNC